MCYTACTFSLDSEQIELESSIVGGRVWVNEWMGGWDKPFTSAIQKKYVLMFTDGRA